VDKLPPYPVDPKKLVGLRGEVDAVQVRPARKQPTVAVDAWTPGDGQDHGKLNRRAVTIVSVEHLLAAQQILGRPIAFAQTRRNVLVRGINLFALMGRTFTVGECVLRGEKWCDPCANMEAAFGPGGYEALLGLSGITASVVHVGQIAPGSTVHLSDAPLDPYLPSE